ncbi:MAG: PAS-domain containing protein [Notoacmeibacter sp.]|nr:PAS-domain containing protein [Notoacmeibacter sp.]MCC0032352.1 PAS-domain containing protein [Brucellaceae bacterium]
MVASTGSEAANTTHVLEGLEHLDQGITIFDQDLRMVAWNRKFLEMYNYPESLAFVGAEFSSFIAYNAARGEYGPGKAEEQVCERVEIARKFLRHRFQRTRRDGSTIEVVGTPLPNGGFVTTYTDISDITRQQEWLQTLVSQKTSALQLSEERLRIVADEVPAGIAHIDRDMTILYANKRFANAYRRTPEEVTGLNANDVLHPRTMAESARFFEQSRRGAQVDFEMRLELPGGRFKDVRTLLRPEKPSSGEVIGFYLLSIDVTRRKSTMSALMRSQKMDALGRMASGISHDFNNLLTIILGNLVPLSEHLSDPVLVEEYLAPSISAARRGSELTKRMLSLARREQFDPVATNIGEAVEETCKLLRSSLPHSLKIVESQSHNLPPALVDRSQLEMALLNLALNARDATSGSGTVTIETSLCRLAAEDAETLRITAGDYVRIRFNDDGCGMSQEHAERIFEPFFTSKSAGAGSGLGLSMVYGFVQQSNGAIWVDSEPDKGSRFTILLPGVDTAKPAGKARKPVPRRRTRGLEGKELVLLVEDDPDVRRIIRRKIAELGHSLLEAGDADEARRLLAKNRDIAIVISDVEMPGSMNGIGLAAHVRERRPGTAMILMSGSTSMVASTLTNGLPFLKKPFTLEALQAILAEVTGNQQAGAAK